MFKKRNTQILGAALAAVLMTASVFGTAAVQAEDTAGLSYASEADETAEADQAEDQTSDTIISDAAFQLSTAYPGVTAKAGDSLTFSLDFETQDGISHDISLSTESIPDEWTGYFKGDVGQVTKLHISSDNEQNKDLVTYNVSVPADVAEGEYSIDLLAVDENGTRSPLTLDIAVSTAEIGESSFTSQYPRQQGATGSTFTFDTTIVNNRALNQTYSLSANAPTGWQVSFTPSDDSTAVTSIEVEAGSSKGITVTVTPTETVEQGDYDISCSAVSANDTLNMDLSVSITGTYGVSISTPNQNLSFDAYADKATTVTLVITNTGNVALDNLNLASSVSTDWDVSFSDSTIDTLEAGASKEITADVTPSSDAITGDYVAEITVSNTLVKSAADFRVSVKTPTTWGYTAVAIIIVLLIIIGIIFKKYGRR